MGQGLSGWVAENRKPIINGNPSVEPGYLNDPAKFSTCVRRWRCRWKGVTGVIGVLALYHARARRLHQRPPAHSAGDQREDGAVHRERAEVPAGGDSATTDYLTGLPNARSLFLQLDRELARCKRDNDVRWPSWSATWMASSRSTTASAIWKATACCALFAQALKDSCREYDYVARMGGDEFVVIAPGLAADAAGKKAEQLKALARQAGIEVCGEDILSLSVGRAVYPDDGNDAEQLAGRSRPPHVPGKTETAFL